MNSLLLTPEQNVSGGLLLVQLRQSEVPPVKFECVLMVRSQQGFVLLSESKSFCEGPGLGNLFLHCLRVHFLKQLNCHFLAVELHGGQFPCLPPKQALAGIERSEHLLVLLAQELGLTAEHLGHLLAVLLEHAFGLLQEDGPFALDFVVFGPDQVPNPLLKQLLHALDLPVFFSCLPPQQVEVLAAGQLRVLRLLDVPIQVLHQIVHFLQALRSLLIVLLIGCQFFRNLVGFVKLEGVYFALDLFGNFGLDLCSQSFEFRPDF